MALDKANEEKVVQWLTTKGQLVCPLCKGVAWGIGDLVGVPVVPTPLSGPILNFAGSPVSLQVQLTCIGCAHVVFFAAAPIGITAHPKPETVGLPGRTDPKGG
jgi:hypothetical protein